MVLIFIETSEGHGVLDLDNCRASIVQLKTHLTRAISQTNMDKGQRESFGRLETIGYNISKDLVTAGLQLINRISTMELMQPTVYG